MAINGTAFGRPGVTTADRDAIMQGASLNAIPSPAEPAGIVEHPTLQDYKRLYYSANELIHREKDLSRLHMLHDVRKFSDAVIAEIQGTDVTAGPPAPSLPPQMAGGAPQAGAMPGIPPGPPGPPPGPAPAVSGANPLAGAMPPGQ
jgi:hypothetical protein